MVNILRALGFGTLLITGIPNLHAVSVENHCNAQFPKVTPERANGLIGIGNQMEEASRELDRASCIGLMYTTIREVQGMMGAQVQIDRFIDDAFKQAENKGMRFTAKQKADCKNDLLIFPVMKHGYYDGVELVPSDGVINFGAYQKYQDQPRYKAPIRLDVGLTLIICGGLVAFIPFPGCQVAGAGFMMTGFTFMAEACIQGAEKQGY